MKTSLAFCGNRKPGKVHIQITSRKHLEWYQVKHNHNQLEPRGTRTKPLCTTLGSICAVVSQDGAEMVTSR